MEQEVLTVQPEKDNAAETAPLVTQPGVQTPAEQQVQGIPVVDGNVNNQPQVTETQRRKVSDYYKERERIRKIEQANRDLTQKYDELSNLYKELKTPKPAVSEARRLTAEALLNDPEKELSLRDERLLSEINALKEQFNQVANNRAETEKQLEQQEALELLFPKTSPDADETLEERITNEERKELLMKIHKANPGLDRLMTIAPLEAAKLTLVMLGNQRPVSSPNTINKSLMGKTNTGNPSAGAKQKVAAEDLMSELRKLTKEATDKKELRFNKDHMKRRADLMKEIEKLAKEKSA